MSTLRATLLILQKDLLVELRRWDEAALGAAVDVAQGIVRRQ